MLSLALSKRARPTGCIETSPEISAGKKLVHLLPLLSSPNPILFLFLALTVCLSVCLSKRQQQTTDWCPGYIWPLLIKCENEKHIAHVAAI